MKARPRAAFVVTVSIAGSLLASGCHKESKKPTSSCEPPECHMNPPPPDTGRPPTANPPPVVVDGGQPAIPSSNPDPVSK